MLKPLLEDKAVLKVAQNMKYDWLVFAQRGIEIDGYDDTMLISYVLDAGKGGHGMDDLANDGSTTRPSISTRRRPGKTQVTLRLRRNRQGHEYAAEDADVTLRLWYALKARLAAERVTSVYEALERAMPTVLARMERRGISIDRQVLSRLSGEFAQKQGRAGGRDQDARRRTGQSRLAQAHFGDILFGKMKSARRRQDQRRAVVDRRARTGRPGRAGPRAAAQDPRLAAGVQAALDLYRGAAQLRQSRHHRVHTSIRAGGDHHRPALLVRTEPAEHPDPHRRRPQIRRAFVATRA